MRKTGDVYTILLTMKSVLTGKPDKYYLVSYKTDTKGEIFFAGMYMTDFRIKPTATEHTTPHLWRQERLLKKISVFLKRPLYAIAVNV